MDYKFTQIEASKSCMDLTVNCAVVLGNSYIRKLEYACYSKWTFSKLAFICSSFSKALLYYTCY